MANNKQLTVASAPSGDYGRFSPLSVHTSADSDDSLTSSTVPKRKNAICEESSIEELRNVPYLMLKKFCKRRGLGGNGTRLSLADKIYEDFQRIDNFRKIHDREMDEEKAMEDSFVLNSAVSHNPVLSNESIPHTSLQAGLHRLKLILDG